MNPIPLRARALVPYAIGLLLSMLWLGDVSAQEPAKPAEKPPEPKAAPPPPRESPPSEGVPQDAKPDAKPDAKQPDQPVKPEAGKVVVSPILTAKLALMADPRVFPYDINVETNGDALILKGKVPSEAHKTAAAEIVHSLAKSVKNDLEVVKDLERDITRNRDEAITHYVKERFSKSKTLEKADFGVKTEDGVVALTGKTRFQVIVLEAAEAARHVPGVKAVKADGVRLESE
jgi:osmotically-inducible protein OsmY